MRADQEDQIAKWAADALETGQRIADALEALVDLLKSTPDTTDDESSSQHAHAAPELRDAGQWSVEEEERSAIIDMLEDEGVSVPADAYKRLGLEPPRREDDPDTSGGMEPAEPIEPQEPPEPDDPSIVTAVRR